MGLFLEKGDLLQFAAVHQDMVAQFPPTERKSQNAFRNLLAAPDYTLWMAYDGRCPVAYFMVYEDRGQKVVWLDYFAVFRSYQGRGYGSRLLPELAASYPDMKGAFLEVEPPDATLPATTRRIRFYQSCGAIPTGIPYAYPHADGILPMALFFLPFQKKAAPLASSFVISAIERVFLRLHKDLPHAGQILSAIRSNQRIPATAFPGPHPSCQDAP